MKDGYEGVIYIVWAIKRGHEIWGIVAIRFFGEVACPKNRKQCMINHMHIDSIILSWSHLNPIQLCQSTNNTNAAMSKHATCFNRYTKNTSNTKIAIFQE